MESIVEFLESREDFERRIKEVFQYTKEYVLDRAETGHTSIYELSKAEKTMLGIKFECVFKKEFGLETGQRLDCVIDGQEVDIKFTCRNNWMISPRCFNEICLLAKMDDDRFSFGIIQATKDRLTKSANWDRKKQICLSGRGNIQWFFKGHEL